MNRPVRKLFDLEIDEVSTVDRPANQHGLIAFAKNDTQEDQMDFFDSEGAPVDTDVLEHGDVVYDEDGTEYVFAEDDADVDDRELAEVGKASLIEAGMRGRAAAAAAGRRGARGVQRGRGAVGSRKARAQARFANNPFGAGYKVGRGGGSATPGAIIAASGDPAVTGGASMKFERGFERGVHFGRNRNRYLAGGGSLAALGAGGYGYEKTKKSLGDSVLEQLSKAVTDSDREEIIAKALDEVEVIKAQNDELSKALEAEQDARITEAFISKAEEYNLPVSPAVLGPILKAVAEVLSDEELDVLDQLFESVGDTLYREVGYVGDTDNVSVLDQVDAYAQELVGKADVSLAEAQVALLASNPDLYDAYIAENGR